MRAMGAGASAKPLEAVASLSGDELNKVISEMTEASFKLNGTAYKCVSVRPLELDRLSIYSTHFPDCIGADKVMAVIAEADGVQKEFTAVSKGGVISDVKGTCAISLMDILPSETIEYAFSEAPDKWAVAQISLDQLEDYRKRKFGQWMELLLHSECEAQLRRMLQAGVISRVYDDFVFPTPEEFKHLFKVKCEKTGRMVNIPHPVAALRIWNASERKYNDLDPSLEGAPSEEEKETWWAGMLDSMRTERGADYVDGLLGGEAPDDDEAPAKIADLKFELNGSVFKFLGEKPLELERAAIYGAAIPGIVGADRVVAVMAEGDGGQREFTVVVKGSAASVVKGTCAITLAELLPSEAVEYAFIEAPENWYVAQISRDALEHYTKTKFGQWKELLTCGECEAQLRRMLQAGVITAVYDDVVFPTPEEYRHLFKVKCEKTGRMVNIPHPVAALRVWNASKSGYEELSPALEGAPAEEEKEAWWAAMLTSLKEDRGPEYIESLLMGEHDDDCGASAAIADLKFELNGSTFKFLSDQPLAKERKAIYSLAIPEIAAADKVMAVLAESESGKKEFTAVLKGSMFSLVKGECSITLAELLPSEAIEYAFGEAPDRWALAKISMDALDMYKKSKFSQWKEMLLKGQCEAQLRRMLQAGVVSAMYDDVVFPTPEEYRHLFKVKCEKTGRMVNIPHPVAALRVWNATESKYDDLNPVLEGAPSEEEKEAWWANMLKELKEVRGEEYIDGLLGGAPGVDEE